MSVGGVIIPLLENRKVGKKMNTNTKCKCEREHILTDVLTTTGNGLEVVNRQKWHKCFYCQKWQVSKWIRLHEVRCDTRWARSLA